MEGTRFRQVDRMSLCLPLRVSRRKHTRKAGSFLWQMHPETEYTVTENIGSGGCYFFLSREFPLGTRLEMEVTIPGEIPGVPLARIYCRGKVIRVDPPPKEQGSVPPRFGVAATIERLHDVNVKSIPTPTGHAAGAAIV